MAAASEEQLHSEGTRMHRCCSVLGNGSQRHHVARKWITDDLQRRMEVVAVESISLDIINATTIWQPNSLTADVGTRHQHAPPGSSSNW